ncbi:MAG: hypothetical protein Q8L28_00205 [bacterium]|nr:hypothetical protein [bacterium]
MGILSNLSLLFVGKIFALIGLGIYIIFALVVVRQVSLMVATIEVGYEIFIKIIAWAHLIFAVFVFLTALNIL